MVQMAGCKIFSICKFRSSANFLSMVLLKEKFPDGGEVIVPPLTWNSDIVSVICAGFKPIFCDIRRDTSGS